MTDAAHARDVMVETYFRWAAARKRVALVTSTNAEADAINEAIQERRVDLGQLRSAHLAVGQGEQRLLEGDVVQTRLNDRAADVENRALWTIRRIGPDALELVALGDSADVRSVSLDYAAEHVHLAYASTVHGIQGETTDASIVGPGVDASGLYVGMTRGRIHNEAIAIAWTVDAARDQIADSMMRGVAEVTIEDSMRAARSELGRAARVPGNENPQVAIGPGRRLDRWLEESRTALASLDARIAGDEARRHGRGGDLEPERKLVASRRRLADLVAGVVRSQVDGGFEAGGVERSSAPAGRAKAEVVHGGGIDSARSDSMSF